jgi:hypothetical protein
VSTWDDALAAAKAVADATDSVLDATLAALGEAKRERDRLRADLDAAQIRIAELEAQIPKPRPVGIYNGTPTATAADPDAAATTAFGARPPIASSYYIGNTVPPLGSESARLSAGTSALIACGTKNGPITLADIAAQTPAALSWVDARVERLHALSRVNPAAKVYAALEIEFEVKVNRGEPHVAGVGEATYAKALDVWHARLHAGAPDVVTCYWFGGSDWTAIRAILGAMTVAPKLITLDPYRNPGASSSATFADIVRPKLAALKQSAGFVALGAPLVAISETGTDRSFGDASVAAYIASIPAGLADLDLGFALWFNRDSGPTNACRLDGQGMSLSVAALGDAFEG